MDNQQYIAHLTKNKDPHLLEEHLKKVAKKAEAFILDPILKPLANLGGKWHDLGKYRKKFQDYIRAVTEDEKQNAHLEPPEGEGSNNKKKVQKTTHSMAGAVHARKQLGAIGDILAYIIAGHHAGLADGVSANNPRASLEYRIRNAEEEYNESMAADILTEIFSCRY